MMLLIFFIASLATVFGATSNEPRFNQRIIDGENAALGEFPYQVSVQINGYHMCGGTILSKTWIVTAAQCIYVEDITRYKIRAGITNIRNPDKTMQERDALEIVVNPDYQSGKLGNDIALIQVSEPFDFIGSSVAKIKLAQGDEVGDVIIVGWGSISTSIYPIYPGILKKAYVILIDNNECEKAIVKLIGTSSDLSISNVCTGPLHEANHGFCTEDTGGPLIYSDETDKLVGVMSWGFKPCGTLGAPSVYTKVAAFSRFIKKFVKV